MIPTALIAEDEPLMRTRLKAALAATWPALNLVAEAENGIEAIQQFESLQPAIVFLDIQMPGKTGLEVAAHIGDRAHIVFVTAYDEYAIKAFENGAADYLLKPVEQNRLATTVARLQSKILAGNPQPPADLTAMVQTLLETSLKKVAAKPSWIRASVGNTTRLINIHDVLFFQSDTKYTRIVTPELEALVRTPLKELLADLDTDVFWQVHRGSIVNAHAIDRAVREGPERLILHLKNCKETLQVSRQYFSLFKES
jgi:DNA-binding LytR/AlgR family response regulator